MKTQEEIDEVYKKLYLSLDDSPHYHTWVRGYTQCQEDIKPLLKDLWDLWERLAEVGELHIGKNFTKKYEELKNSLNKQD